MIGFLIVEWAGQSPPSTLRYVSASKSTEARGRTPSLGRGFPITPEISDLREMNCVSSLYVGGFVQGVFPCVFEPTRSIRLQGRYGCNVTHLSNPNPPAANCFHCDRNEPMKNCTVSTTPVSDIYKRKN